jgi:gamma-glutamylcyclotransferase (GGCT)/AIG2-like uncharacterized protein YtfP
MTDALLAVYGTLRKGYGLNRYLSEERATYLGTKRIKGFKLYAFSDKHWSYPSLTRTDNMADIATVELYKFHDTLAGNDAEARVDDIEYGARYFSEEIEIDGDIYKVFLKDDDKMKDMFHIESGDFNVYSQVLGYGK